MNTNAILNLPRRVRATYIHLIVSALIAAISGALIFTFWFPPPFGEIAGGLRLFLLLVCVDVFIGPLLTAVVADSKKPRRELRRDIAIIAFVQLTAFAYGVYSISLARPVYLAFEVQQFHLVTAANIDPDMLHEAPDGMKSLPWTGPQLIAAVKPATANEQFLAIQLGLGGVDLSMVPRNWRAYSSQITKAWDVAKPVSQLTAKYPQAATDVARLAQRAGKPIGGIRFLPLMARQSTWVVLISSPGARIVGYLPFDGYF